MKRCIARDLYFHWGNTSDRWWNKAFVNSTFAPRNSSCLYDSQDDGGDLTGLLIGLLSIGMILTGTVVYVYLLARVCLCTFVRFGFRVLFRLRTMHYRWASLSHKRRLMLIFAMLVLTSQTVLRRTRSADDYHCRHGGKGRHRMVRFRRRRCGGKGTRATSCKEGKSTSIFAGASQHRISFLNGGETRRGG